MINDVCLETVNCGEGKYASGLRTRRIIGADELLFLLLWSSGYIGSKIGLPLSGTLVAVFRYAIAVLLVGAYVSLRSEWHWPDQRSLLIGFWGIFFGLFCSQGA